MLLQGAILKWKFMRKKIAEMMPSVHVIANC